MSTIIQRSNRRYITKKIIDLMIDFLRDNFKYNRLYNNVKITDRFSMTSAILPSIIVRQTSNSAKRLHYDDFMFDVIGKCQLTPLTADNVLVGNNVQRTNLPISVDWSPIRPFDNTIGVPPGSDIADVGFSSQVSGFPSGATSTGIIINVPPPTTFNPSSVLYIKDTPVSEWYPKPSGITSYDGQYTAAIGRTGDQFYFIYSGSFYDPSISGNISVGPVVKPVAPDEYIVDPTGMSGVTIQLSDVLFAGDQYSIETYADEKFIAERYGGRYDITINFDLYAESTLELQELADFCESFLVQRKFDLWNKAGFNTTEWSKGGESEKAYLNEYIFQASMTCSGFTEWFEDRSADRISSMIIYPVPIGGYDTKGNSVQMLYFVWSGTTFPAYSGTIWPSGNWAPIGPSGHYIQISGNTYNTIYNQFLPYSSETFIIP